MLIRQSKWSWGIYLFLETLLFIFHHDSLMNGLAWPVMCKQSPMLAPSKRQLFTHAVITTQPFIPSLPVWHGMMYSLAAFCTTEIPGCWPYAGEVNLFTWTFDDLCLSLHVAMNEHAMIVTQSYTQNQSTRKNVWKHYQLPLSLKLSISNRQYFL